MKPKNNSESFRSRIKTDGMNTKRRSPVWPRKLRQMWGWYGIFRQAGETETGGGFIKRTGYRHADPILRQVRLVCECVLVVFVLNEVCCCLWLFFCKEESWNSKCPWAWRPVESLRSLSPNSEPGAPAWRHQIYMSCSFWLRDRCYASMQISFTCSPPPMFTESERI